MSTADPTARRSPLASSPSTLWLPALRSDQKRIVEELARRQVVVLAMGRRWGKTVLGGVLSLASAASGARVAWVVPAYKNGRPLWRWAEGLSRPLVISGDAQINRSERTIEFPAAGGFLGIYSTDDQGDAMRGESFHLVIMDEAAKSPEMAWTDAIQPTLADYSGRALLISTPRGRNWFWREYERGQDASQDLMRSFTAPSSDNPNPQIQRAARLAQERVSERTYQQEWLAQFVDDAGGVFRGVRACVAGDLRDGPRAPNERYVIGVDLAKYQDFTVCVVMDTQARTVVAFDRFHQADWGVQKERIRALARHWNDAAIWMDATGVGDPIVDDLQRVGLRVNPFRISGATVKQGLIDNAVLLIEQRQVTFPLIPLLVAELEAYEYERTTLGTLRMNAPSGQHDDCVIAFALACWPLARQSAWRLDESVLDALRRPVSEIGGSKILHKRF